jgi:hypothetical protein
MRTPRFFIALIGVAQLFFASPPAKASATIAGKVITIKYGAPSARGRQIFGDAGLLSKDWTYPVWRAGANAATTLVTGADLDIDHDYRKHWNDSARVGESRRVGPDPGKVTKRTAILAESPGSAAPGRHCQRHGHTPTKCFSVREFRRKRTRFALESY